MKSGPDDAPSITYRDDAESDITNIMTQLSTTRANEVDGKLSDALRNFLFGHEDAEDLAGRNIFRGRELGIPTYGGLAACFGLEHDATVCHAAALAAAPAPRTPPPCSQASTQPP